MYCRSWQASAKKSSIANKPKEFSLARGRVSYRFSRAILLCTSWSFLLPRAKIFATAASAMHCHAPGCIHLTSLLLRRTQLQVDRCAGMATIVRRPEWSPSVWQLRTLDGHEPRRTHVSLVRREGSPEAWLCYESLCTAANATSGLPPRGGLDINRRSRSPS
jgi:hypothetical protein